MSTPNQIKTHYKISKYRSNTVVYAAEVEYVYAREIKMFGAKILQAILATLTFTVQLIPEDDGSITASLEELDGRA